VIERIQHDMGKLLQTPDIKVAFERAGTDIVVTDSKVFGELLKEDYAKWARAVNDSGAQLQ